MIPYQSQVHSGLDLMCDKSISNAGCERSLGNIGLFVCISERCELPFVGQISAWVLKHPDADVFSTALLY